MMQYKGYTASVEYDDSIDEFVGTTVDMKDVLSFGGKNTDELKASFHKVVDAYIKMCADEGVAPEKPYQGKISLRIPAALHRKVDIAATAYGMSINNFIQGALTSALDVVPPVKHGTRLAVSDKKKHIKTARRRLAK